MDLQPPTQSLPVDQAQQSVSSIPPVSEDQQSSLAKGADMLPPLDPSVPVPSSVPDQAPSPVAAVSEVPATQKHSPLAPATAEDVDLIEKEWVVKAKEIINSTSNNPNEQSKEMSKFKADYLKIRYSKDLKVSE